jgi:hypothetical protein
MAGTTTVVVTVIEVSHRESPAADERRLSAADSGSAVTLGLGNHPGITTIRVTRIEHDASSRYRGSSDFGSTLAVSKGCWFWAS